ncbi:MAG: aldo/keto reductase [Litorilinea sp.]
MQYKTFGKTGWEVSSIGLGTWNIGNQWGEIDDVTAWATVRAAFEHGVNLFDTAESYGIPNGIAEERLGTALVGLRHRVYIVSKIGNWGKRTGGGLPKTSVDLIRISGHAILHRLRTDYLDVVLCHEGDLQDPDIYLAGFEALKAEGRLRAYGISTNSLDVLKRFNVNNTCSVVQVDYSLLNRAPESDFLPYCQEHNIGVMVRGPLAKGLLSGRYTHESIFTDDVRAVWHADEKSQAAYRAQIDQVEAIKSRLPADADMISTALRYVISHPAISTAIPGAKSPQQAIANAAAGAEYLPASLLETLQQ